MTGALSICKLIMDAEGLESDNLSMNTVFIFHARHISAYAKIVRTKTNIIYYLHENQILWCSQLLATNYVSTCRIIINVLINFNSVTFQNISMNIISGNNKLLTTEHCLSFHLKSLRFKIQRIRTITSDV